MKISIEATTSLTPAGHAAVSAVVLRKEIGVAEFGLVPRRIPHDAVKTIKGIGKLYLVVEKTIRGRVVAYFFQQSVW